MSNTPADTIVSPAPTGWFPGCHAKFPEYLLQNRRITYRRAGIICIVSHLGLIWSLIYLFGLISIQDRPMVFYDDEFLGFNITEPDGKYCAFYTKNITSTIEFNYLYKTGSQFVVDLAVIIMSSIWFTRFMAPYIKHCRIRRGEVSVSSDIEFINTGETMIAYAGLICILAYYIVSLLNNVILYMELNTSGGNYWVYSLLRGVIPEGAGLLACSDYYVKCPVFSVFNHDSFDCIVSVSGVNLDQYRITTIGDISYSIDYYDYYSSAASLEMVIVPSVLIAHSVVLYQMI